MIPSVHDGVGVGVVGVVVCVVGVLLGVVWSCGCAIMGCFGTVSGRGSGSRGATMGEKRRLAPRRPALVAARAR